MQTPVTTRIDIPESIAKRIILVQTLEQEKGAHPGFSTEQRREATETIWHGIPEKQRPKLSDAEWVLQVLYPRATRLFDKACANEHCLRNLVDDAHWRRPLTIAVWTAAFLIGIFLNHLPNADRINLLAVPFGLFIAWNWVVIASMLMPRGRTRAANSLLDWLLDCWPVLLRLPMIHGANEPKRRHFHVTVRGYWCRWLASAPALALARLRMMLHVFSLFVALGIAASLTVLALNSQLRVGWESTLCGGQCAHFVHNTMFLPAGPVCPASTILSCQRQLS